MNLVSAIVYLESHHRAYLGEEFGLEYPYQLQACKMSREGALWIGGLESYMDEAFILKALQEVGEDKVASVKVCKTFCRT